MKKALCIMLVLGMMMTAAGCGGGGKNEGGAPAAAQGQAQQQQQEQAPTQQHATDQAGSAENVIAGEVSSISGSTVELKLIEMPQPGPRGKQNQQSNQQMQAQDANKGPDAGQGQKAPNNDSGQNPGAPPEAGGNPPEKSENSGSDRMQRQSGLKYTGETKTIDIPDGVEITAMQRGDKGMEQKTISIGDIKVGDILRIWYSDESMTSISRISVMQKAGNQ
ncbi:MAG: hypothetical protein NUV45_05420 [Tepidanaerobacteraceae bacterium]|jgi:hypothetical protein|nr:hypothetical protein [Tepidanaerobacteraceae bacterium]